LGAFIVGSTIALTIFIITPILSALTLICSVLTRSVLFFWISIFCAFFAPLLRASKNQM
jgi:hypothetical protein